MNDIRKNNIVALDAEDATISTATISIKAIQVGKKQMTQSVFRQLPPSPLVDEVDVQLIGIPWGWVNYHWGDIPVRCTNFIFQVGGRLFRDAFWVRPSGDLCADPYVDYDVPDKVPKHFQGLKNKWWSMTYAHNCASIIEGWRPEPLVDRYGSVSRKWGRSYSSSVFRYRVDHDRIVDKIDRLVQEDPPSYMTSDPQRLDRWEIEQAKNRNAVMESLTAEVARTLGSGMTVSQIEAHMKSVESYAADYCRRWDALMQQLRGVEQLYIAC